MSADRTVPSFRYLLYFCKLSVSLQRGYFADFRKVIVTSLQESQRTLV